MNTWKAMFGMLYSTIVIIPPSLCLLDYHLRYILRVHYPQQPAFAISSPDDLLAVVFTISSPHVG